MAFKKTVKLVKSLLLKSAVLQIEIEQESRRANPDWVRLLTLKKQRLYVKDSLRKLMSKRSRGMVYARS